MSMMVEHRVHALELGAKEVEGRLDRLEEDGVEHKVKHDRMKDLVIDHDRYIAGQRAIWRLLVALGAINLVGTVGLLVSILSMVK
jgi:hypothetical protein